jgi:hypothetical protein
MAFIIIESSVLEYNQTKIYKPQFKRDYTVEYQARKNDNKYQIRIPMLNDSQSHGNSQYFFVPYALE